MRLSRSGLVPLFVLTSAIATVGRAPGQCGASQLVTPPNYASDNGGGIGGAVYFTLDVTAPNGVSICGIAVNTSAFGPINATLYVHQSISDVTQLGAVNNAASDWCEVAGVSGTGNGSDQPSPCTIQNGTNSLDLPPGQYLIALGNGDFAHRYTAGTGCLPGNQCNSDPNVGFRGGQASNAFPGPTTLFAPRVFNGTIDYDVGVTPVTLSPCLKAGAAGTVGAGCGGGPAVVAELFGTWDLTDRMAQPATAHDVRIVGSGAGYAVDAVPGTTLLPPVAAPLGLDDDETTPLLPLGFDLGAFGMPCRDAISIDSNGCVWLGVEGASDFSETLGEFEGGEARLAPYWTDLQTGLAGGAGTVHVDQTPTETLVTWNGIALWGTVTAVTCQCSITASEIRFRYDATAAFANAGLVGITNGIGTSGTVSSDLTASTYVVTGGAPVALVATQTPSLGGALSLEVSRLPAGGLGAIQLDLGPPTAGVPLIGPLFAANCSNYLPSPVPVSLGLVVNADACQTYAASSSVPANPAFLCLPFAAQAAAFDFATNQVVTSNAIDAVTGNF
ncbi:MAG: hypothetical protein NXI31_25670 [bacterium]|nr:hypothetical protein [bacterium]